MNKNVAISLAIMFAVAGCGGSTESVAPNTKQVSAMREMRAGDAAPTAQPSATEFQITGYRSSYTIARNDDGTITLTNAATTAAQIFPANTTLLKFYDKYTSFDTTGIESQIFRLYQAAFNRKPDPGGLGFWLKAAQIGYDFPAIAQQFINSAEFVRTYGANSNDAFFINTLYNNVLHRTGETGGVTWWIAALGRGATRPAVLYGFSESAENQKNLLSAETEGFDYIPYQPATNPYNVDCTGTATGEKATVLGNYIVDANQWGTANLPKSVKLQECIQGTTQQNSISASWTWELPQWSADVNGINGLPKAFPEIIFGQQFFGTQKPLNTILPVKIANVNNLAVNYDTTITMDGIAATFFDLSFTSSLPVSSTSAQLDIAVNIIPDIRDYSAWMKQIGTATIDGHVYDVFYMSSTVSKNGTITFNIRDDASKGTFHVKAFTDYLAANGYLSNDSYLAAIEFGTEIVAGTGTVMVNSYSIE